MWRTIFEVEFMERKPFNEIAIGFRFKAGYLRIDQLATVKDKQTAATTTKKSTSNHELAMPFAITYLQKMHITHK